jgi:dUTPase
MITIKFDPKHIERKDLEYATAKSAAFDVYADIDQDIELLPLVPYKIPTGVYLEKYEHCDDCKHLIVTSKSGLFVNSGLLIVPGLIDIDYKLEICVMCFCLQYLTIKKGQKIAQVLTASHDTCGGVVSKETIRQGGFGSTLL